MMKTYPYQQVNSIDALPAPQELTGLIGHYAFQYIDFTKIPEYALGHTFVDCCFFGCTMCPGQEYRFLDCLVLPRMGMIFHAFTPDLYSADTLYAGFDPEKPETFSETFDAKVYADYLEHGEMCSDMRVTLARSLHDHSIYDAMNDFLQQYDPQSVIGIMGGHGLKRADPGYAKIAKISKALTEKGKLMISGGGPGAMEATHLGAWMAGRTEAELQEAVDMLAQAGESDNAVWLSSAFAVREKFPQDKYSSLSIPTWVYGHEPSTPLSTHIAKYFLNSIREDMILSVAQGGIIFTPGSAGTMQEIFQDASKLHYDTDGIIGPMVFLGKDFYTEEIPVYPFLEDLVARGKYKNLKLSITDSEEEIIAYM